MSGPAPASSIALGVVALCSSSTAGPAWAEPRSLAAALAEVTRCERAAAHDDIVVCGTGAERSRFRLPPGSPPEPGDPRAVSVSRERNALVERGADGVMSCSPVGAGGEWGCTARAMKHAAEQHRGDPR